MEFFELFSIALCGSVDAPLDGVELSFDESLGMGHPELGDEVGDQARFAFGLDGGVADDLVELKDQAALAPDERTRRVGRGRAECGDLRLAGRIMLHECAGHLGEEPQSRGGSGPGPDGSGGAVRQCEGLSPHGDGVVSLDDAKRLFAAVGRVVQGFFPPARVDLVPQVARPTEGESMLLRDGAVDLPAREAGGETIFNLV